MTRRLLLIGGGHAHVGVLAALGREPLRDADGAPWEVTLVSPYERQVYSGMLPGWIAGHYRIEQCVIPLRPLAQRAGVRYVQAHATGLALAARTAQTDIGETLPFDLVSIDIGPAFDWATLPGAREHAVALRPIEHFIVAWQQLHARLAQAGTVPATIVGGGAGGVEIALAWAHRAQREALPLRLQLVCGRAGPVPTLPPAVGARLRHWLARSEVRLIEDEAAGVHADAVQLAGGEPLPSAGTLAATGAAAVAWPAQAGLAVDARGFIAVDEHLRSTSHPFVFATGDCATMVEHPRPKSGVYAVRAGPPLAFNLRRIAAERAPQRYLPQRRALYLLATGPQHAIGVWGKLVAEGDWVWRWKDWIDRRFMAMYGAEA
jgi:selenide,water dikinase